jgi:hypothetical protein
MVRKDVGRRRSFCLFVSKLLFICVEASVVLSKFLVTVEVSVFVERMREEDKRKRLERQ